MMKNKCIKSLLIYILTLVTFMSCISTPIYSHAAIDLSKGINDADDTDDTEKTDSTGGIYSADDSDEEKEWEYITISTVDELMDFSDRCRLDSFSENKYVKLAADINLAGSDYKPMPVFCGVFDGCGHKIDGFIYSGNESFIGLISRTAPAAVVRDLTVGGNVSPDGKQMVLGGIVGDNYGLIQKCSYVGIVKGNDYVGGIVGYNESTGMIMDCMSYGNITGQHYTGGIAGANAGGIYRCTNEAEINTTNEDKGTSFDDINIDKYLSGILNLTDGSGESKEINAANSSIDCGGIVGHSMGVVEFCTNTGHVGYEHVGYNVGGIAGRQSGYVHGCVNKGKVLGRKDVGGIVGQAEPYMTADLSEDIVNKLTVNINELHDLVDATLTDSDGQSDIISARLDIIRKFTDDALGNIKYLSNGTIDWANGLTGAANEMLSRVDYAVDEANKDDGVIDNSKSAANNVGKAADALSEAAEAADIYNYMTPEETARYDAARERMKNNSEEYERYYGDVYNSYYYLYIDKGMHTSDATKKYCGKEDDLAAYNEDGELVYSDVDDGTTYWPEKTEAVNVDISNVNNIKNKYNSISYIRHTDTDGNATVFPSTDETQAEYDNALIKDASSSAEAKATAYADGQYNANGHAKSYTQEMTDDAKIIADIVAAHEGDMSSDASDSTKEAMDALEKASDNLRTATSETEKIVDNLSGREDITLPNLDAGYKAETNSLMAALQGVSDNMGYLNSELNGSTDILTDDMQRVNDSFNTIMLLFTDALDGVLDMDYGDIYEDESLELALVSTDGVIADCTNRGRIQGDIDTAGIAGTMAIEYEFDLESDTTGVEDSRAGSVYKTRCILRDNLNEGRITSGKSYAGGQTGLQEMGIITGCENYGRIISNSGDYVGGIAGSSMSDIHGCYSKCILSGGKYIGGIAGYGCNIKNSVAMPSVSEAESLSGAIAGEVSDEYSIEDNIFCSETLGGIDRISYRGMAEPVTYEELLQTENIPEEFGSIRVTFITDDEEMGTVKVAYGDTLTYEDYPKPYVERSDYINWETDTIEDIITDMEIEGEVSKLLTTISGTQLRGNGQSVILVDGSFREGQTLSTKEYKDVPESADVTANVRNRLIERWELSIPDDKEASHNIRLQCPDNDKRYDIYVGDGNTYYPVDTEEMGMYKIFEAKGNEISILIIDKSRNKIVYIAAGVIAAAAAAISVLIVVRKKRRKKSNGDNK